MENKRNYISGIIFGAIGLFIAGVGISYAWFSSAIINPIGSSINVEMARLGNIVFVDGSEIILPEAYPGDILTKTFTISREGEYDIEYTDANYVIKLNVTNNTLTSVANGEFVYNLTGETNGTGTLVSAVNQIVPTSTAQIGNTGTLIGIETHTYTFTIGLRETGTNQSSTLNHGFSGYLQVEATDEFVDFSSYYGENFYKVENLATNGSFEDDMAYWNPLTNVTASSVKSKFGTKSARNLGGSQWSGAYFNHINGEKNHIYYASNWMYTTAKGTNYCYTTFNFYYDNTSHWSYPPTGYQSNLNVWEKKSTVQTAPNVDDLQIGFAAADYGGTDRAQDCYADGVVIIDLTETFGEGNEPCTTTDKTWCDANLDYFDGTKTVYYSR